MQVVPYAVGQSEGTVVFWEDNAEIGVAWPRKAQVIDEIRWGMGSMNQEECLILYLFAGKQVAELYLPEQLPTTPNESIEIWRLVCAWRPELIKLRYGTTPLDSDKEVTFLLPTREGDDIVDTLRRFRDVTAEAESTTEAAAHAEFLGRVDACLDEVADRAR